ncbi:MAG: hypothetical protein Roseis2KO_09380 [Roseivirga sp.]
MKLDGDLMHLRTFAVVSFPAMFQVGADQHKLNITYFLHAVTNDSTATFALVDEVKLKFRMEVDGEIELVFYTLKD